MFSERFAKKKKHHIINAAYNTDAPILSQNFWYRFCRHQRLNGQQTGVVKDTFVLERPHSDRYVHNYIGYATCMQLVDVYKDFPSQSVHEYIIAGSNDFLLQVWRRERNINNLRNDESKNVWQCKHVVKGHYNSVSCIQVLNSHYFDIKPTNSELVTNQNSNNLIIASGSYDATVKIWTMPLYTDEEMKCVETLHGHTDWIRSITLQSSDRMKIVSASRDDTLRVWDYEKNKCTGVYNVHATPFVTVDASKLVQNSVLSGSTRGGLTMWDTRSNHVIHENRNHENVVSAICTIDDHMFATASYDHSIKIYDTRNLSSPCVDIKTAHNSAITSMDLESKYIVSVSVDGWLKMFDLTGHCTQAFVTPTMLGNTNVVTREREYRVRYSDKGIIADNDSVDTLLLWAKESGHTSSELSPIPTTYFRPTSAYSTDNVSLFQRIHYFDFDETKIVASVEQHLPSIDTAINVNRRNRLQQRENEVRTKGFLCLVILGFV
jgi:WD40 repeat protein